ncbi:phosphate signaling complex protein PhoU [Streptococcus zalophi]|uniref:Phosphate-specific transport system accessory protein PhoU n=1 Tax=Streptococcus zalophi TaxID=640031 RepID=A0A934UDC1_9STRE|nr:phosphate signaling complex protein PhoU [Streptococcus zalophi]MBJ8349514.1 phosphate signaling complex protein PhoU [Streptococcus zalophi]
MFRTQFEEELEKLHNQFYAMGTEVLSQIGKTVRAFVSHDTDLAQETIDEDKVVNDYEIKLEKKSLEIIALQQPVSQDLRMVITVLKASSDIERMGDHAVSMARATIRTKGQLTLDNVENEINELGRQVKIMVEAALNAYIKRDEKRAKEVARLDDQIDEDTKRIRQLTLEEIRNQPDALLSGKEYFQVLVDLERIADYATNLCEWVVYLKTGKIIEL